MAELFQQLFDAMRTLDGAGETTGPTREQYVEWAHGQAALENPDVTREVAERAVDKVLAEK